MSLSDKTRAKIEAMADRFSKNEMASDFERAPMNHGHRVGATPWAEWCERFMYSDAMTSVRDSLMGHYPKQDALAKLDHLEKEYREWLEDIDG